MLAHYGKSPSLWSPQGDLLFTSWGRKGDTGGPQVNLWAKAPAVALENLVPPPPKKPGPIYVLCWGLPDGDCD